MNIIYLHQYFKFPNENGGTRSYDLAKSFVKNGIKVNVVTSTSEQKYKTNKKWTVIEKDGLIIHYIYLPYDNNLSYLQRSLVFIKFLWFSSIHLLKLKCDVVLATSTPLTIGIPALIKKKFNKTPFIFEVRDVWPEAVIAIGALKNKKLQKLLYSLERKIYKNAKVIVPLSTDMQKSIVVRYPQFREKADVVIENISELNRFQKLKDKIYLKDIIGFNPRFSILYAGTFGKVNGIEYIIDLAEKTLNLDSSLVYILIGAGSMKNKVIEYAKEKEVLNNNVFILNPVSKGELPIWYNSVNMGSSFVAPIKELWANSANKFFDTLASSKPILINHEGWQAKIIREDNLGYVLPPFLTDDEIKKFVDYTNDKETNNLHSKNAFIKANNCYSLSIAVEKYMGIFNNLINQHRINK